MSGLCLVSLAIALVASFISFSTMEEIVQVFAILITILSLFLSLMFASMLVKLLLVIVLLASYLYHPRFRRWGDRQG